jgi:hypothetical protein
MTCRFRVAAAIVMGLTIGAASAACHRGAREHAGVLAIARTATEGTEAAGSDARPRVESGPSVPAHARAGAPPFSVLARQARITKAPCATCHTVPLAAMKSPAAGDRRSAHWSVALQHAAPSVMACTTCHAASNLNVLRTLEGTAVEFDHAYELCAQCHAKQRADWEGGAHGKRVAGWTPPRVVYNCTECHDPHRPAFPSRWPARAGRSTSDR